MRRQQAAVGRGCPGRAGSTRKAPEVIAVDVTAAAGGLCNPGKGAGFSGAHGESELPVGVGVIDPICSRLEVHL